MLSRKTYLVTGATGFIGKALVARLQAAGHTVRCAVRHPTTLKNEVCCGLDADVTQWVEALQDVAGVFHLAWSTIPSTAHVNPVSDLEINVSGTMHLLDAIRQSADIPLVFSSSGGTVYGKPDRVPIPEAHPLRPLSIYGASKSAAESYALAYRREFGVDARVARISNPYGPGQNVNGQQGAASVFAWRTLNRLPIEIWGDGLVVRDYLYIEDTVDALCRVMDTPRAVFDDEHAVLNIGSGIGISLNQILVTIEQLSGIKPIVTYKATRNFDVPTNILDISTAQRMLDWTPRTEFSSGMADMLRYLIEQQSLIQAAAKTEIAQ